MARWIEEGFWEISLRRGFWVFFFSRVGGILILVDCDEEKSGRVVL